MKKELPIFDWQNCLEISNNNPRIAKEILKEFLAELPLMLERVNQFYQDKNYTELKETIHQLNGACSYCGVLHLRQIVEQIESTLRSSQINNLETHLKTLNQEIERILHTLNEKFLNDLPQ
jgi:two-component system sensor histidine kinase BarA